MPGGNSLPAHVRYAFISSRFDSIANLVLGTDIANNEYYAGAISTSSAKVIVRGRLARTNRRRVTLTPINHTAFLGDRSA
ncbi:MAG TPA: hypothetical protein VK524_07735 [Polyangiaceae bacterium]|nr:hypothetical protein [Polyangiaceae bacterium]